MGKLTWKYFLQPIFSIEIPKPKLFQLNTALYYKYFKIFPPFQSIKYMKNKITVCTSLSQSCCHGHLLCQHHFKFHLKSKQDIEKRKRGHPLNLRTNFIETSIFNGEQRGTDGQSINWIWLPIKFLAVNCWIRSSFIMLLTWGIVSKMLLNGQIYWSFGCAFLQQHYQQQQKVDHQAREKVSIKTILVLLAVL